MTATVLGIRVTDAQLARWRNWVMPPVQPFLLTPDEARSVRRVARSRRLTPELRDTFQLYAVPGTGVYAVEAETTRNGAHRVDDSVRAASEGTAVVPGTGAVAHPTAAAYLAAAAGPGVAAGPESAEVAAGPERVAPPEAAARLDGAVDSVAAGPRTAARREVGAAPDGAAPDGAAPDGAAPDAAIDSAAASDPETVAHPVATVAAPESVADPEASPERTVLVWLDKGGARLLDSEALTAQPTKHRWPGKHPDRSRDRDTTRTIRWIEDGWPESRHSEVSEATWRRARAILPDARRIAGRFPARSGPNCFGTVMGAAGVEGAANTWMQREPFERWLRDATIVGGNDDNPGTVLVWRGTDGAVEHAAITIGDGWLLNKPAQTWSTPVAVLSVREGINASRAPGRRLERHTLA